MDLVFSQSGGVNLNREGQLSNDNSASTKEKGWVEYNGLKSVLRTKTVRICAGAYSQENTWWRINIHKWLDHYTKYKYIYTARNDWNKPLQASTNLCNM